MSLISCGVRAAPYLHCHSNAAALVTLPRGFHATSHVTLHAQDPFIEAWLIPQVLQKTSTQAQLWRWGGISGCAPRGAKGLCQGQSCLPGKRWKLSSVLQEHHSVINPDLGSYKAYISCSVLTHLGFGGFFVLFCY